MQRSLITLALCCLAPVLAVAQPPTLPRVASTNLCADLVLLQLAAPEQILSVSYQSQNSELSSVADQAQAYPINHGAVEELLYLHPDIALVYPGWTGRRHAERLAGQGIETLSIPFPRDWNDALTTARGVAERIGRAEVAEQRIVQAEQRLRALALRTKPYRVLYLRPNGGIAGADTYVDGALRALGLINYAAAQGYRGWGGFPLERLISDPPDLFLLGYFDRNQALNSNAYGRHPLLRDLLKRIPAIRMPNQAWGCGGLELVGAIEWIAEQIERLPNHP